VNRGLAAARNSLLAEARGDFLAWLDCDDTATPDRVEQQVGRMNRVPGAILCGSWTRTTGESESASVESVTEVTERWCTSSRYLESMMFFSNPLSTSSVMLRLAAPGRTGLPPVRELQFRQAFAPAEDYDFWLRCMAYGPTLMVPRVLTLRTELSTGAVSTGKARQARAVSEIRRTLLGDLGFASDEVSLDLLESLTPPYDEDFIDEHWQELTAWVDGLVAANRASHYLDAGAFAQVAYGKLFRALYGHVDPATPARVRRRDLRRSFWRGGRWLTRRFVESSAPEPIAGWLL
jgi:glycosyltransferase involved in cell wall biosynthesis